MPDQSLLCLRVVIALLKECCDLHPRLWLLGGLRVGPENASPPGWGLTLCRYNWAGERGLLVWGRPCDRFLFYSRTPNYTRQLKGWRGRCVFGRGTGDLLLLSKTKSLPRGRASETFDDYGKLPLKSAKILSSEFCGVRIVIPTVSSRRSEVSPVPVPPSP